MSMSKEEAEAYLTNSIPLGFRFEPTDVELVGFYLKRKIDEQPLPPNRIWEVKLYKYDPDTLAGENMPSNGKWYFFTPRDRKYLKGSRPDRSAGKGYWKAVGSDKPINYNGNQVGWKRTLVYYRGKQPNGEKSNWIMHEFVLASKRTCNSNMKLDEWVLCKMYKKEEKKKEEENAEAKVDEQEEAEVAKVAVETETQIQKQAYGNIPPQHMFQAGDFNVQPQQSYYQRPFHDNNVAYGSTFASTSGAAVPQSIYPDDHQFQFDYNFAYGSTYASTSGGFSQFPDFYYDPASAPPAPTIPPDNPDDHFQYHTDPQMQQETSGLGFTEEEYNLLTTAFGFGNT